MNRFALVLGLVVLTGCSVGTVTGSSRLEPSAPVGSLTFGRESPATTPASRSIEARPVEARAPQQAREPHTVRFECRSCAR